MSGYPSKNQFYHYGEALAMNQIENGWLLGGNDPVIRQAVCPIIYLHEHGSPEYEDVLEGTLGNIITALREGYTLRWCAVSGVLGYRFNLFSAF